MTAPSQRARYIADEAGIPSVEAFALWHIEDACKEARHAAETRQRELCAQVADSFSGPIWTEEERTIAKRIATAIRDQEQFAVAARMRGVEVVT